MSVVQGKNVVFQVSDKVIACLRSCTLNTSTSFVKTTTEGDGKGATFKPKENTTTGSAEGIEYINEAGKLTIAELMYLQLNHALLSGYFESADESGNTATYFIDFYISNLSKTGSVGDFGTFQFDMQVTGDPVIEVSGCAPTDIEWSSESGLTNQIITFTFVPSAYSETIDVYMASAGDPFMDPPNSVANSSPLILVRPLGVYDFKFKTTGICASETLIEDVGNP